MFYCGVIFWYQVSGHYGIARFMGSNTTNVFLTAETIERFRIACKANVRFAFKFEKIST